jgi:serine/threonine-protein kinase
MVPGVGKYRYIAALADGGMANVFLAVTTGGFEKLFVIKQLRAALAEDPTFVTMFMNEARLSARLNHPNVVQTYEVGSENGIHFLAMEFLEGVSYVRFARLRERIPPPVSFHVRILIEVLRGLHYAHELKDFGGAALNVVHRDVSPQNVMLTFTGGVKVLDFGIAKAALTQEQRPQEFKGKLEYMSPEQALLHPVDRRADVFSVGVMLWEAIARRRLYGKGEDKYLKLIAGELPNILEVRSDAPSRLAQICTRAMAHHPGSRYPTADAMADDLEEWLGDTTQHVTPRDVGVYVSEKFADTRRKLSEAIEAQLTAFRALPENGSLPISRIPITEAPPDFMPDVAAPLAQTRVLANPLVAASTPPEAAREPTSPQPFMVGLAAFLGVAVLGAGIILAMRTREQAGAPTPASSGSAEVAAAEIEYTVRASPARRRSSSTEKRSLEIRCRGSTRATARCTSSAPKRPGTSRAPSK